MAVFTGMWGREEGGQREREIDGKRERKRKRHRAAGEGGGGKGNKQIGGEQGGEGGNRAWKVCREDCGFKWLGCTMFPKLQIKLCRAAPGSLGFKAGGGEFLLWLRGSEPD